MLTNEILADARKSIVNAWGEDGKSVIAACEKVTSLNVTFGEFLNTCQASGGDWGKMLLSGIKAASEEVYDAIPKRMGKTGNQAFLNLCNVAQLLGVDTSA